MDKYESRRIRLRKLIDERCGGVIAKIAEATGKEPSYFSRLLAPPENRHSRRMGNKTIDLLEEKFQLPRGWFDMEFQNQEQIQVPAEPMTEREQVMMGLFSGLTKAQQDELIRRAKDAKQLNQSLIEELIIMQKLTA